jgi:hypothetical protein
MTVKEKIVKKSIAVIEKRLAAIKQIQDARPLSKIIELHQQAKAIVDEHDKDYQTIADLIKPLANEEKKQRLLMKKQQNMKLWDEQFKLESELQELKHELFTINMKKGIRK